MCYDVAYLTKRVEKYAAHYGRKEDFISLKSKLPPVYHTNGFDHADVPVIANDNPDHVQSFEWGLIPRWIKDVASANKIANSTLNARGEEMFSKPSFREAAAKRRCLVVLDAFYDHHWKGDKSFPYLIKQKSDEPFSVAGIWEIWRLPGEEIEKNTFSIITGPANPLMAKIHNKPKASEGPRMPVIIPKNREEEWLDQSLSKEDVLSFIKPFDERNLEAYTVNRLRGKLYKGNVPELFDEVNYEELDSSQASLF